MFGIYFWKWGMWVRVFGALAWVAVDDGSPLLFSEREGYRKVYRVAGLKFKFEGRRGR